MVNGGHQNSRISGYKSPSKTKNQSVSVLSPSISAKKQKLGDLENEEHSPSQKSPVCSPKVPPRRSRRTVEGEESRRHEETYNTQEEDSVMPSKNYSCK